MTATPGPFSIGLDLSLHHVPFSLFPLSLQCKEKKNLPGLTLLANPSVGHIESENVGRNAVIALQCLLLSRRWICHWQGISGAATCRKRSQVKTLKWMKGSSRMVLLWGRQTAASGQLLVVIGLRTPELLSFLPEEKKTQKCTCRLSTRRVKAELPRAVAALILSDLSIRRKITRSHKNFGERYHPVAVWL